MTKSYRVRWEIDIEADSAREAAEKAQAIQRKKSSIATVFDVARMDPPTGVPTAEEFVFEEALEFETIDLLDEKDIE